MGTADLSVEITTSTRLVGASLAAGQAYPTPFDMSLDNDFGGFVYAFKGQQPGSKTNLPLSDIDFEFIFGNDNPWPTSVLITAPDGDALTLYFIRI